MNLKTNNYQMELSVIIVSYNVRYFLEQCLNSVRKASENIDCEIFVVDNNSVDGSCSMISLQFPEVSLIRNPVNAGFSAANNQAIKLAKGKFILLLNPDTVVEEDTFTKCLRFMKETPGSGAIGVKMINGSGKLLPESKRSLPTPQTAFFKMSGFSLLFPKSRLFNKYYLGHLDSSKTSEAEIISGAFMFIRKEALDKTGLLDESFFMYGEDIDLSYRLIKAGYKNYYYPDVKIIHYKGESTKKENINNTVYFYKAMIIFTKKHFEKNGPGAFHLFIKLAIYFWGLVSILRNFFRKFLLPVADAALLCILFILIILLWEKYKFEGGYKYPDLFTYLVVPSYSIITVFSIFLAGGYKIPSRIINTIKGIIIGTIILLVIYALLPQDLRFSRAVIVICGITALIIIPLYHSILAMTGLQIIENPFTKARRTVIAGDDTGFNNIRQLIIDSQLNNNVVGRVSIKPEDIGPEVLGNIDQIKEVIRVNRIDEVIFSTREISASMIINSMHLLSDSNITLKIAPSGEKLIIGSSTANHNGEIYSVDHSLFKNRSPNKGKS
jgi:O-antigen biosynthesis protein